MRPFGRENQQALFATKNVSITKINFVGANKNIIQFVFSDELNNIFKGISFKGFDKFQKIISENFNDEIKTQIFQGNLENLFLMFDIVYSIEINEYNGNRNVQLVIKDFRVSNTNW